MHVFIPMGFPGMHLEMQASAITVRTAAQPEATCPASRIRVPATLESGTPRCSQPPCPDAFSPDYPGSRPVTQLQQRRERDEHMSIKIPPAA